MSRFLIEELPMKGLRVIQRKPIGDERGYLERLFCADALKEIIDHRSIVQINHTLTAKAGTIRGLHYQKPPHAEMKIVYCLRGEVCDVAVDLRKESPTFLHWNAQVLSEGNHRAFVIPEGFAHGFQTLTDQCELVYLHTAPYEPGAEAGLDALDPRIGIEWPLPISERSSRDQQHAEINGEFSGLSL